MRLATLLCFLLVAILFHTGTASRQSRLVAYVLPPKEVTNEQEYEKASTLTQSFFGALDGVQDARKLIGEVAYARAFKDLYEEAGTGVLSDNPFALCGVGWEDLIDLEIWRADFKRTLRFPAVLQYVGKKQKGGEFWQTPLPEPAGFLVKSVHKAELPLLAGMRNAISDHYANCADLQSSVLLPVLFTFKEGGEDYIVMRHETLHLKEVAGELWNVVENYDIKPLPNLSDDLPALISQLLEFLNQGSSPILRTWEGWQAVSDAIATAVAWLDTSGAVDYSLFIHVLLPAQLCGDGECAGTRVDGLDATRGCIMEPMGKMIACIKIIDYMTPYTAWRGVESYGKGGKFDDYAGKFLQAWECLGNINAEQCAEYRAYARVKRKVSPTPGSDAKALAFVRSSLFEREYQCKISQPEIFWLAHTHSTFATARHIARLSQQAQASASTASVRMIDTRPQYSKKVAQRLRVALLRTQDVGKLFHEQLRDAHDDSITTIEKKLPEAKVEECVTGIQAFATHTWSWKPPRNKDLENVAWSSAMKSVFVVREKPFLSSNDDVVKAMSKSGCFMRTSLYRCQPIKGYSVKMNYTLKFGSLEILKVEATHYSGQFPAWAESREFSRLAGMSETSKRTLSLQLHPPNGTSRTERLDLVDTRWQDAQPQVSPLSLSDMETVAGEIRGTISNWPD